jgi:hypothetical protein
MTTPTVPTLITKSGIYDGIPEDLYHADMVPEGSLSSTGAKTILASAARYAWEQEHPQERKREFDLGSAFHRRILGVGADLVDIDAENYTKGGKVARDARDAAYDRGAIPLLPKERAQLDGMAAAFRRSDAARLLTGGRSEVSMFWVDGETGMWCRGRLDYFNGRAVDLKTTTNAAPDAHGRTCAAYGYHIQAAFYLRGLEALAALGLIERPPGGFEFVFAFVEKKPPYLSSSGALTAADLGTGDELCARALRRFADCQATGHWPGYPAGIHTISLPRWTSYLPEEDLL